MRVWLKASRRTIDISHIVRVKISTEIIFERLSHEYISFRFIVQSAKLREAALICKIFFLNYLQHLYAHCQQYLHDFLITSKFIVNAKASLLSCIVSSFYSIHHSNRESSWITIRITMLATTWLIESITIVKKMEWDAYTMWLIIVF